jgi:hypothetical protein
MKIKNLKIPVIFHDFHVLVTVAKRVNTSADSDTEDGLKKEPGVDFYQLAVKDLNLNQLQLLHVCSAQMSLKFYNSLIIVGTHSLE